VATRGKRSERPAGANGNKKVCFRKALVIGYGWYGKYYQTETGQVQTYFARPRELQDTDPIMLHVVSSVRKWAGLEEVLPSARSTSQPVILVASRSKLMRNRYSTPVATPWNGTAQQAATTA
jgi:hypothetical protein